MRYARIGAAIALMVFAGALACAEDDVYGAEPNPTGDPIGGGEGYSRIVREGDFTASTADELLDALQQAQAGQVIYVNPDAEIDLSGHYGLTLPEGVTLAGNRGDDGAPGPLLFTTDIPDHKSFLVAASGCRITGLRVRGKDCNYPEIDYDKVPRSWTQGIMAVGEGIEVDNCEISNFHHSGVCVQCTDIHIHHNLIHDVHAYPVVIAGNARPPTLIEANIIYWVWHSIAGTGTPGTGYEARYNIIIGGAIPASWGKRYHCFDMHAFRPASRAGHERIAGDTILIHHNTVRNMGDALGGRIRGVPREVCEIHHNWFSSPDVSQAMEQLEPHCNLWMHDNAHGPDRTVVALDDRSTARIIFRNPPPPEAEPPVVSGDLTLDFEVEMMPGLTLQNVTVELEGEQLYSGAAAPKPGEVVINTRGLSNGVHSFTVTATDTRGVAAEYPRFIEVRN
ncbi:MAG: right-handed parallel beta-helix repeat-containing protein [Armatimonadetes bacterium]|nr:right-handed parallel beta-helix repeat-containing protein [Armatimonadota bacterium]